MCCTVVLCDQRTSLCIYFQCNRITGFDHTFCHTADMSDFTAEHFYRIFYTELTLCSADITGISGLSTHSCIEWSLIHKNSTCLTICQCFYDLCLAGQNSYFRIMTETVISDKCSCNGRIDRIINRCICPHIVCYFSCVTCFGTLLFHRCLKTCLINRKSFFFQNFFGQIYRKSICVVQTECIFSGKNFLSFFFHLCLHISQNCKSLIDCLIEFFLFLCQYTENEFFFLFQFRITVFALVDDSFAQFRKEQSVDTKHFTMSCRTTDQTTKYIASALVGRHDTI